MRFVRTPLESRLLLFAASVLVPRCLRADWRREWDGEIWWWLTTQPESAHVVRERLALALHCAGAISDGFCLWFEDEYRLARLGTVLRGPRACLAAGVSLVALIGVLSGGFENTQRSLQAVFHPRNPDLAILSQTGPFMGQRLGVPSLKVAYWDRHSASLQGAAVYASYRSVMGGDSSHTSDVVAAKVGVRFFSLLGTKPQMGRVFGSDDLESCRSCAVIGYDFWDRRLRADPGIVGRTITVDNRPFRVIGVLRKEFWFPGERPAVWSLFDETIWKGFPSAMTGAICLLKPGTSPVVAGQELRALAREVVPRESGTWVTVDPLDAIVSRPIASLGPLFIAFAGLALLCALGRSVVRGELRAEAFLLAKTLVFLSVIFLAAFEFAGAASITRFGGSTAGAGMAFCWLIVAGSLSVRWSWNDQRKRCRQCLGRLMLPVRIGEGSRMLLEPGGTERACPSGHGVLFTAEGDSMAPKDRWYPLDATWCDLFAPVAKTTR
jgi:MacB-like periplasmic core domain